MYWIDPKTCEIVVEEINSTSEEEIIYSESTIRKIQGRKGLITMHSHPNSFPPSISDLNSNYVNEYDIGIVICHDGKIYIYLSDQEINPGYYQLVVEEFRKNGYNDFEAQVNTLNELQSKFYISCKEVTEYGYST